MERPKRRLAALVPEAMRRRRGRPEDRDPADCGADSQPLNIQPLRLVCAVHDEAEPSGGILPHELMDHPVSRDLVVDIDPQQATSLGVMVVSHKTFGIISPRPLNRVISADRFP